MNDFTDGRVLEYLREVRKNPKGFIGMHILLSKLKHENFTQQKLKILIASFEKMGGNVATKMFLLANNDLVGIAKNVPSKMIYNITEDIKKLFYRDPMVLNHQELVKLYDFDGNTDSLMFTIKSIMENYVKAKPSGMPQANVAIDPNHLDEVMSKLDTTNIISALQKQDVIVISHSDIGEVFFKEYYVSIDRLKKILATNANLLSDRWLFKHLTEGLDRKMLLILSELDIAESVKLSLNLNISTLSSPEFLNLSRKRKLIVEVQLSDIFEDAKGYNKAYDTLRSNGHKLLIDSINEEVLRHIDISKFKADYIKILWDKRWAAGGDTKRNDEFIKDAVGKLGADRVVLCRCDDEKAVMWGLGKGITFYQGYFVDNIVGAMIKKEYGGDFSIKDCIECRRAVDPDLKVLFKRGDILDKDPPIRIGGLK